MAAHLAQDSYRDLAGAVQQQRNQVLKDGVSTRVMPDCLRGGTAHPWAVMGQERHGCPRQAIGVVIIEALQRCRDLPGQTRAAQHRAVYRSRISPLSPPPPPGH